MTDVPSKHVWKIKESRIVFKDIPTKYLYTCKMTESQPSYLQFLNNLKLQWKIEQFSSIYALHRPHR